MLSPDALARLARLIATSDRDAFADVFGAFRDPLLRYAHSVVGDAAVANDLVQDVFVALWEGRHTLDPETPLAPTLYRMARNRALNHVRDRRLHEAVHDGIRRDADAPAEPHDTLDADALGVRLRAWIGALPERQREALVLTRDRGLSHHDAAALMGVSPRTLNNHVVRALTQLHARLATYAPDLARPLRR